MIPGKSWNLTMIPGKSWNLTMIPGKSWKVKLSRHFGNSFCI